MFTYDVSIFLTSTAFVDTKAKIRHIPFEIYRIFENCPLEEHPNGRHLLFVFTYVQTPFHSFKAAKRELLATKSSLFCLSNLFINSSEKSHTVCAFLCIKRHTFVYRTNVCLFSV